MLGSTLLAGLTALALLGGGSAQQGTPEEEAVWPGAACTHTQSGRPGQCTPLPSCHSAVSQRKRGDYPQACGFSGSSPIPVVCCPLDDVPPRSPAAQPADHAEPPAPAQAAASPETPAPQDKLNAAVEGATSPSSTTTEPSATPGPQTSELSASASPQTTELSEAASPPTQTTELSAAGTPSPQAIEQSAATTPDPETTGIAAAASTPSPQYNELVAPNASADATTRCPPLQARFVLEEVLESLGELLKAVEGLGIRPGEPAAAVRSEAAPSSSSSPQSTVLVECWLDGQTTDCDQPSASGTVGTLRCAPGHRPPAGSPGHLETRCEPDGRWSPAPRGLTHCVSETAVLTEGSPTFESWKNPPGKHQLKVYLYNVTNADEFLDEGQKPILVEVGPYVYDQEWEKVAVAFHDSDSTVSFQQRKVYRFNRDQSIGDVADNVIVPNIPMLSTTTQARFAKRFMLDAMTSIMDILKIKPFVEVSVEQLLWGYEDPLLKLAKDVLPKEQKLPYDEFGLFVQKNGTAKDVVTVFTGASDVTRSGLIDRFGGKRTLPHWKTPECNRLDGSDGSLFPPNVTKDTTLHLYFKDFCRLLPLRFLREVETHGSDVAYRFTPPDNVFAEVSQNPENECFCAEGPPCAPHGLMNVTLCRYDEPVMMSFPHFHLADSQLRDRFVGIDKPAAERDMFYVDVDPKTGLTVGARARVQFNLDVTQVTGIKQAANFPSILFPIMWYEETFDGLLAPNAEPATH